MEVQKTSLVDIVIDRIKQYIVDQNLEPGDRFLTEKELIDQLQVSRTVVREALISLQAVGILTIKRGGGVFISDSSIASISKILQHHYDTYGVKIRELIETRRIMELGALRLIIEKQLHVNLAKLHDLNHAYYESIINKQDTKKYDQLFHQSLMKATGNETYCNLSKIITDYFRLAKIDLIQNETALINSYKQHTNIIEAIEQKNLFIAQEVMADHFEPIFAFINKMEDDHETNSSGRKNVT